MGWRLGNETYGGGGAATRLADGCVAEGGIEFNEGGTPVTLSGGAAGLDVDYNGSTKLRVSSVIYAQASALRLQSEMHYGAGAVSELAVDGAATAYLTICDDGGGAALTCELSGGTYDQRRVVNKGTNALTVAGDIDGGLSVSIRSGGSAEFWHNGVEWKLIAGEVL